ncbi:MAG: PIN domain-containing protein [Opitutales bacterium]|nr:PIN domain-containing protein [Opitutales bacterium]
MRIECFFDTNVFLYAASADPADTGKKAVAQALIRDRSHAVSPQVIAEFIDNAGRKARLGISEERLSAAVEAMLAGVVTVVDTATMESAWAIRRRYGLRIYDALVVAAARQAGASLLYSEDLNDGQDYGGVRVVNPFSGK